MSILRGQKRPVILSEAKDLGSLENDTKDEILRFAQDNELRIFAND